MDNSTLSYPNLETVCISNHRIACLLIRFQSLAADEAEKKAEADKEAADKQAAEKAQKEEEEKAKAAAAEKLAAELAEKEATRVKEAEAEAAKALKEREAENAAAKRRRAELYLPSIPIDEICHPQNLWKVYPESTGSFEHFSLKSLHLLTILPNSKKNICQCSSCFSICHLRHTERLEYMDFTKLTSCYVRILRVEHMTAERKRLSKRSKQRRREKQKRISKKQRWRRGRQTRKRMLQLRLKLLRKSAKLKPLRHPQLKTYGSQSSESLSMCRKQMPYESTK